jgi:hypothetical protein
MPQTAAFVRDGVRLVLAGVLVDEAVVVEPCDRRDASPLVTTVTVLPRRSWTSACSGGVH